MRLVRGRAFAEADYDHPQTLAIVNEALARQYFPGEDPIGHQIDGRQSGRWKTIIGVVAGFQESGAESAAGGANVSQRRGPLSMAPIWPSWCATSATESLFSDAVRASLREIDPGLLAKFETLDQAIGRMSAGSRFNGVLVGSFAAMAFLMAVVGVYGVLAFAVTQRTQEFGIRMALGAGPRNLRGLVLKEAVVLVGIGTVLGSAMSLAVSRYLKTLLYDVTATDPRTYLAVVLAIGIAAIAAAWIPARRAASLDPAVTLRNS